MATSPTFYTTAVASQVQISTANTNRDGSGVVGTVIQGVAAGTLIRKVTAKAVGTTTAGMIRYFVSYDNGVTKRLIKEIAVTAITPNGTTQAFESVWTPERDLLLPDASAYLYAATHNNEQFNIIAEGYKG